MLHVSSFSRLVVMVLGMFMMSVISPHPVRAALVPCGLSADDPATAVIESSPCTACHVVLGAEGLIDWGMGIMTVIAIAIIVALGIMYVVSAGNQGLMQKAKSGIFASLIGFTVMLGAWLIVNTTLHIFSATNILGLVRTDAGFSFSCDTSSTAGTGSARGASGQFVVNTQSTIALSPQSPPFIMQEIGAGESTTLVAEVGADVRVSEDNPILITAEEDHLSSAGKRFLSFFIPTVFSADDDITITPNIITDAQQLSDGVTITASEALIEETDFSVVYSQDGEMLALVNVTVNPQRVAATTGPYYCYGRGGLEQEYASLEALKEDANNKNIQSAIHVDGANVHHGFGPALACHSQKSSDFVALPDPVPTPEGNGESVSDEGCRDWNFTDSHVEKFSLGRADLGTPERQRCYRTGYHIFPESETKKFWWPDSLPENQRIGLGAKALGFRFDNALGLTPIVSRHPNSVEPVCPGKDVYAFRGTPMANKNYSGVCVLDITDSQGKPVAYYLNFVLKKGMLEGGAQVKVLTVGDHNPRLCPDDYDAKTRSCPTGGSADSSTGGSASGQSGGSSGDTAPVTGNSSALPAGPYYCYGRGGLAQQYATIEELKADAKAKGIQSAIHVNGKNVYFGFGPALSCNTQSQNTSSGSGGPSSPGSSSSELSGPILDWTFRSGIWQKFALNRPEIGYPESGRSYRFSWSLLPQDVRNTFDDERLCIGTANRPSAPFIKFFNEGSAAYVMSSKPHSKEPVCPDKKFGFGKTYFAFRDTCADRLEYPTPGVCFLDKVDSDGNPAIYYLNYFANGGNHPVGADTLWYHRAGEPGVCPGHFNMKTFSCQKDPVNQD